MYVHTYMRTPLCDCMRVYYAQQGGRAGHTSSILNDTVLKNREIQRKKNCLKLLSFPDAAIMPPRNGR